MKRVTGIGGIFFLAKDPVALRAWYKNHLGIDVQPRIRRGAVDRRRDVDDDLAEVALTGQVHRFFEDAVFQQVILRRLEVGQAGRLG